MNSKMLFEYGNYIELGSSKEAELLEDCLIQIWKDRETAAGESEESEEDSEEYKEVKDPRYQPFVRFSGRRFRARNYAGFIFSESGLIEIYPKVFSGQVPDRSIRQKMFSHIMHWLQYVERERFPFSDAPLGIADIDNFPEQIIYLFASKCLDIVESKPYSRFEETAEALQTPRGRIDFGAYIRNNASYGNFHLLDCVHEPFIYDNKLNRGLKYVCRILLNYSSSAAVIKMLNEIIHVLDEVSDEVCTADELDQLKINPLFSDYVHIRDWCSRFLRQQTYSPLNDDYRQWVFLFNMEYIFEEYIAGIVKKYFRNDYDILKQPMDYYLSTSPEAFMLKNDLRLDVKKKGSEQGDGKVLLNAAENDTNAFRIIIDTKYKLLGRYNSKYNGVSQQDMYQMLSYGYRQKCRNLILLYPNENEKLTKDCQFQMESSFNPGDKINVYIREVPFWSAEGDFNPKKLEHRLKTRLEEIFNSILSK